MPVVSLLTSSGVKPIFLCFVVMLVLVSNCTTLRSSFLGTSTSEGLSFVLKYSSSLNACLALFNSSIELQGTDNNSSISHLRCSGVLYYCI